ncbi:MAG: hypothetical protein HOV79_27185 [Hamadaea sp.]|nr:hypothetical protein [Hamadaea sp.]
MGFGYKTEWIAVPGATVEQVAHALGLERPQIVPWDEGVTKAYTSGVFVGGPADGFVLAHGRELGDWLVATTAEFPEMLERLSSALGEVQFFSSYRTSSCYAWAMAREGTMVRGFALADGDTPLHLGPVTAIERDLRVGIPLEQIDWDSSETVKPGEETVLQIAASWGVNPIDLVLATHELYSKDMMLTERAVDPKAQLRARARAALETLRERH